ncbi:MAG: ABC transporter permease [Bacteroidales bacterium]|nr:ABC transporter permease [Bacteroidales bacterium]
MSQTKSDPLRTALSLAGVSVGIFVVTLSFALVDGFKQAVVAGFDHFGSDMVMVERFPVVEEGGDSAEESEREAGEEDDGAAAWSRYSMRPMPSREDYLALTQAKDLHESECSGGAFGWTALAADGVAVVTYGSKTLSETKLVGVMGDWLHLVYSTVCEGRNFSQSELNGRDAKVILGARITEALFGSADSQDLYDNICGQTVRISGRPMTVIGTLSHEGRNVINLYATDYAVIVPFAVAEQLCGRESLETMIAIGTGAQQGAASGRDATLGEARQILRASRHLFPAQEDNFALNTMEDLCRETVSITRKITMLGIIVTLFSLLIGAFGIVNIMLVSVKERIWEIGLKKALGATRKHILREFLLEAFALSLLGAAVGLAFAWLATTLIPTDVISARLTAAHIALAFALAAVLGLGSGLAPAAQACDLEPASALRG